MIEVTNEMVCALNENWPTGVARGEGMRLGLAAVLAIVERDWNMQAREAPAVDPFAPLADPCVGCGCPKAWHAGGRCAGDFLHCPCETWMPVEPSGGVS